MRCPSVPPSKRPAVCSPCPKRVASRWHAGRSPQWLRPGRAARIPLRQQACRVQRAPPEGSPPTAPPHLQASGALQRAWPAPARLPPDPAAAASVQAPPDRKWSRCCSISRPQVRLAPRWTAAACHAVSGPGLHTRPLRGQSTAPGDRGPCLKQPQGSAAVRTTLSRLPFCVWTPRAPSRRESGCQTEPE